MRNRFDEQLMELNRELIEMGSMCEEAIAEVAKALTTGDIELAKKSKQMVPVSIIWNVRLREGA